MSAWKSQDHLQSDQQKAGDSVLHLRRSSTTYIHANIRIKHQVIVMIRIHQLALYHVFFDGSFAYLLRRVPINNHRTVEPGGFRHLAVDVRTGNLLAESSVRTTRYN